VSGYPSAIAAEAESAQQLGVPAPLRQHPQCPVRRNAQFSDDRMFVRSHVPNNHVMHAGFDVLIIGSLLPDGMA
jgi:hypothetical protein